MALSTMTKEARCLLLLGARTALFGTRRIASMPALVGPGLGPARSHHAFVPSRQSRQSRQSQQLLLASASASTGIMASSSSSASAQSRAASTSSGSSNRPKGRQRLQRDRPPINDEIAELEVLLMEPSGILTGPHDPRAIVATLDLKKFLLRLTHPAIPYTPPPPMPIVLEEGEEPLPPPPEPRPAICRIINKADEYQAMRAAKVQAREDKEKGIGTKKVKQIELSWSIDRRDMSHKLDKGMGFLGKGMKLEVVIAKRKGAKDFTDEDAANVVQSVRAQVAETPGARESKPMEGEVGRSARLFFEGTKWKS